MLRTITTKSVILTAFDHGDDIQVKIKAIYESERWFSVHTSKGETFGQAAKRVFEHLAELDGATILPIVRL